MSDATARFGWIVTFSLALTACVMGDPASPAALPSSITSWTRQGTPPARAVDIVATIAAPVETQVQVPTSVQLVLPNAGANPLSVWRPPPYPIPWALRPEDHYYLGRPIPSSDVNWPNPRYRYGGTDFGSESVHTGVDLGADPNTPVLAAGSGEVIWVGYGLYRGEYDPTDPYGLAVAIRHDFGYGGQRLFTVYGHMSSTSVWEGQRVDAGEQIGTVGDTGHASGPHLHFEVRMGDNRFSASRNPELWMVPAEGWGVLAGRIVDARGEPLSEKSLQIRSIETGQRWDVWTYAKGTVHPDEVYQENFAISDLPSGPYEVTLITSGKSYSAYLIIHPGQTNVLNFNIRTGFEVDPPLTPTDLSQPPLP